jgi:hypothetical protein
MDFYLSIMWISTLASGRVLPYHQVEFYLSIMWIFNLASGGFLP